MTDVLTYLFAAVIIVWFLSIPVVNGLKGKPYMVVFWFAGFLVPGLQLASIVTMFRLAKPGSWWWNERYGAEKARRAEHRFEAGPGR